MAGLLLSEIFKRCIKGSEGFKAYSSFHSLVSYLKRVPSAVGSLTIPRDTTPNSKYGIALREIVRLNLPQGLPANDPSRPSAGDSALGSVGFPAAARPVEAGGAAPISLPSPSTDSSAPESGGEDLADGTRPVDAGGTASISSPPSPSAGGSAPPVAGGDGLADAAHPASPLPLPPAGGSPLFSPPHPKPAGYERLP